MCLCCFSFSPLWFRNRKWARIRTHSVNDDLMNHHLSVSRSRRTQSFVSRQGFSDSANNLKRVSVHFSLIHKIRSDSKKAWRRVWFKIAGLSNFILTLSFRKNFKERESDEEWNKKEGKRERKVETGKFDSRREKQIENNTSFELRWERERVKEYLKFSKRRFRHGSRTTDVHIIWMQTIAGFGNFYCLGL